MNCRKTHIIPSAQAIRTEKSTPTATESSKVTSGDVRGTTVEAKQTELIKTLKEGVETAMTLAIACCRKLTTVLEMIETEEDLATFKRRTEKKIRDVLKVAKKGVALRKVESYQVVDDS